MTLRLIGIVGKAFSGKDTVAEMIMQSMNIVLDTSRRWSIHSFAGAMKESTECLFHLPEGAASDRSLRSRQLLPFDFTVARFLQLYGQGMRESIDPDFWIKVLFSRYDENSGWIISDVRYRNEAEAIKDRDGILLRIIRPTQQEGTTMVDGRSTSHSSEVEMDTIRADITIVNDSSLDDLHRRVHDALQSYLFRRSIERIIGSSPH